MATIAVLAHEHDRFHSGHYMLQHHIPHWIDAGHIVVLHEGLSEEESLKVWAKLALTLANHIGDRTVIEQAIAVARPRPAA